MSERKIIRAEVNPGDFLWKALQDNLNEDNMS